MTDNRDTTPRFHANLFEIGNIGNTCDICGGHSHRPDGSDGWLLEFLYPRKIVCFLCATAISRTVAASAPTSGADARPES